MSKMRSDSEFSKLTPEQADLLEGWLFEENLSYKDALERAQKEFGIKSSLTGLRRFYGRLAKERNKDNLAYAMRTCVDAASLGNDEVLRAGLLTMANVCAIQFLREQPRDIKQITALLRALTSAQGQEMKRIKFEQEEGRHWRGRMLEEVTKRKNEEEEANARAEAMPSDQGQMTNREQQAAVTSTGSENDATSPRPNDFPSPPQDSCPKIDERSALSGPPEAERGTEVAGSILMRESASVSGGGPERKSGAAIIVPLKAA